MKVTSMKTVLKRLALPLVVGGMLGSDAAWADDIVSMKSDVAGQTFTSSGQTIDFKITLAGYFVLTNAFGGTEALKPEIRMVVNGDIAYATLYSLSQYQLGGFYPRTDCIFRYRVKPGDMAQPLRIYGDTGTPYQFYWNSWAIRSATNLNLDAVWKFNTTPGVSQSALGEVYDLDLAKANITIKTLEFTDGFSPSSVAATESAAWRVSSINPTESAVVSFYVWTPGTNLLQIGSVPNQTWLLVQMPTNTTYKDFSLKGLAIGTTDIYLQRPIDYSRNAAYGVTNYIKKTISVTAPPEPTVRVIMTDTALDYTTLDETSTPNTGSFELQLSEAFTNNMVVRVDLSPASSNVTFAASPLFVPITAGEMRSAVQKYNVPDGTVASAGSGVLLSPVVVSNATAVSKYTRLLAGRVYVRNANPSLTQPLATDTPQAEQHKPYTFNWNVADVPADQASGMTVVWKFGDGTTNVTTHGSSGAVDHTYVTTGSKVVKVQAFDKDGGLSTEVQFTVTVLPPVPQPFVRLAPNVAIYGESAALNSASFDVFLSETYHTAVDIRLVTEPLVQSNLVFASTNVFTIPAGQTNAPIPRAFSLRDGTDASGSTGIKVTPVIVNAASTYFTESRESYIFITNVPPVVAYPVPGDILAAAVPPYNTIPMGSPFSFEYIVNDVPADQSSMIVRWNFGDATTATVTGAVGAVSHTYLSLGDKYVWVEAQDKDGAISARIQFKVTVVSPPPPPTVSILPPAGPLSETAAPNTGTFTVQLSEAFTNDVYVRLTTSPANSAANGTIVLSTNLVKFTANKDTEVVVRFSARDGTDQSYVYGFDVIPQVTGSPTAITHFSTIVPGTINLMNVDPVIQYPTASDPTGAAVFQVPQGAPYTFNWVVNDVPLDLPSMTVRWYFGDGSTYTGTGGTGSYNKTYTTIGDVIVRVVATDKDGGYSELQFKINIAPSKTVLATPKGPNTAIFGDRSVNATLIVPDPTDMTATEGGIGFGTIRSPDARSSYNRLSTYTFQYDPGTVSATLLAIPYKAGAGTYTVTNRTDENGTILPLTGVRWDSYFFCWEGTEALAAENLTPQSATQTAVVTLPESSDTGGTGGTTAAVEAQEVSAVFSLEWLVSDNVGDINADGIPDDVMLRIISQRDGGGGDADSTVWMENLAGVNDDEDYLPLDPTGASGTNDFRAIADPRGGNGNAFTAIREIRGYHLALNRNNSDQQYGSDPQRDEPGAQPYPGATGGTDPTKDDTDGDGLPDGWEYYFWYQAVIKGVTGAKYDPANIAVGTFYDWKDIADDFNPLSGVSDHYSGRDSDFDGLTDVEELTIGTNPTHWDTDGDGLCDGWEIFRGLTPNNPSNGLDSRFNNLDGDYMAYASVDRTYVVTLQGAGADEVEVAYLASGTGAARRYTTVYHYGDDSAPLAVGRPLTLPAGARIVDEIATNALVLHYQVYHEFGFDPRTAWTDSVNGPPLANRWPQWIAGAAPNTKAFTSVDEYLLAKFMSENRQDNGAGYTAGATIGNGAPNLKTLEWDRYTTHPLTPDTDATAALADGVPDGWELYVACRPTTRAMAISPWNNQDYDDDLEPPAPLGDGLAVPREFAGTDSVTAYANAALYGAGLATVTITRPAADATWFNKYWPSNPWLKDTDGDGLTDSAEKAFIYGTPADGGGTCSVGAGLNPNAMDTDLDALTDTWEVDFTQSAAGAADGMDGTVVDYNQDWDEDGLFNYQEYWVQAVRSFRYDIPAAGVGPITGNAPLPMDATFQASMLFVPVTNAWDRSLYPWGDAAPSLWVLLRVGRTPAYVSCDPRNMDTDYDSMDDYYEMHHGLNPILGLSIRADRLDDRVKRAYVVQGLHIIDYGTALPGNDFGQNLPFDFVDHPWLAGMPEADPDADGLLNLEEQLLPNTSAPPNYNTDPTPVWLTDASNPNSAVFRFYQRPDPFVLPMYFWPWNLVPYYMYAYEMNEGYDTDNDGVSDKAEIVDSRNPNSSPQDHDDPVRRQAIWFSGLNSAAGTPTFFSYYATDNPSLVSDIELGFRSFTVELWARPERVTGAEDQILIERPFYYGPSDVSTPEPYVRRNYRIGIAADGRVFASFDNAGADTHDPHTSTVMAYGHILKPNEWVHIAARMNGQDQKFTLFINGAIQDVVETSLVPANGVLVLRDDPSAGTYNVTYYSGSLVLGAANDAPSPLSVTTWAWEQTWADFSKFYRGWIDEVRIWDGARSNDEIRDDYKKRYTYDDLWKNRAQVAEQVARGYTRVAGSGQMLDPVLLHHYTFDNLFGADAPGSITKTPRGFNHVAVQGNRPADPGSQVGWWAGAIGVQSTVYNDYNYVPWIENGVEHLPLYGGTTTNGTVNMTNTVMDSVFWAHTTAGATNYLSAFPNHNNPYGVFYPYYGAPTFSRDLLPLGDAYARQADSMWDCQGPAEAWLETGADSDTDGLADWWEEYVYGAGNLAQGWNDLHKDGSGLTNGERYQRDVANGATPTNPSGANGLKQIADSDGDGMPDWWEKLFNLDANYPNGNSGKDGAGGDPDLDGLSNLAEYQISEVYTNFSIYLSPLLAKTSATNDVTDYFLRVGQMTLGAMFSDHDFMEDWWEDQYDPYYVNRFVYDSLQDYDQDGWSNWSECRYEKNALKSDPSLGMHLDPEGVSAKDFPIPVIETRFAYDGIRTDGPIVINVYSDPEMDGLPDAVFNLPVPNANGQATAFTKSLGFWGSRKITGYLSPGSVVPGSIQLTFTDVSPSGGGYTVNAAYDVFSDLSGRTGVIMGTDGSGWDSAIGTVNYVTGFYELDLGWYQGITMVQLISPTVVAVVRPESSYIEIAYDVSQVTGWPKTVYLSDATTGYLREGPNYFFAFMDVDNSGTWTAGEPCGVPTPFTTDVNWDYNRVRIELTDYTPNYLRMTLLPGARSEDVYWGTFSDDGGGAGGAADTALAGLEARVRIRRTVVDGTVNHQKIVLDKVLDLRQFIHEGDFLAQGDLGLDWGLPEVPTTMNRDTVAYEVFVGNASVLTNNYLAISFTNAFDVVQAKAASRSPINGAYVYASRPTFRWTMPDGYTAFALEIRKGSSTGPVVYDSGEVQAPLRDIVTGDYIWQAPIHAGSKLPNGQVFTSNTLYFWRVTALNPKFTTTTCTPCGLIWSDWKAFRLDVNAPVQSSGYGEIRAVVKYYGPAQEMLSGRVKVQVFDNRGFTGVPVSQSTLTDAQVADLMTPGTTNVNAYLRGLAPSASAGYYYVRAFIDQNLNNLRDPWESWGYANYYGINETPYNVRPFTVEFATFQCNQTASIVIEDADTDQDWFPDAWEYQNYPEEDFLGNIYPAAVWTNGNAEVNTELLRSGAWQGMSMFSVALLGTTDQDGDGLNDMAELILGTDATGAATLGDGYTDGDKASLGLAPQDTLDLSVTALALNGAGASVEWQLAVTKDPSVNRALLSSLLGGTAGGDVTYIIEYTPTLQNPAWTTVQSGSVALDGAQTHLGQIGASSVDVSKGFFRVRLAK